MYVAFGKDTKIQLRGSGREWDYSQLHSQFVTL